MLTQRTESDASSTPRVAKNSGRQILKWAVRIVGAAATAMAYIKWKEVAEAYELENGITGTYRPIMLGLAYYVLWVFSRRIDGSSYKDTERRGNDPQVVSRFEAALFALFVCVAIAFGFFAANLVYVEAVDRSVAVVAAQALAFIAYFAAAGVVLGTLNKVVPKESTADST